VCRYENNFINNRVSSYSNGIFFPGRGSGQGAARGKVCTTQSPYGVVRGNTLHHTIRFGLYVDNNFPKQVKKDKNGFVDRVGTSRRRCWHLSPVREGLAALVAVSASLWEGRPKHSAISRQFQTLGARSPVLVACVRAIPIDGRLCTGDPH
jgi:hypothetical protein